jgi:hypothetical protein
MDSMIVWSRMALISRFRFWIIPSLGVQASDAYDIPMVGYLLELLCDGSPFGATIKMRQPSLAESPLALIPISG